MKKITITLAAIAAVTSAAVIACNSSTSPSTNQEGIVEITGPANGTALVERGSYLVTIMGCNDCHSPKQMGPQGPVIDSSRLLSGHPAQLPIPEAPAELINSFVLFNHSQTAFIGSWGTSFAANISSDATGIGNWTEAQFFKAMREGRYKGLENTRSLLPPMPWETYRMTTDEDLRAIFAYLKSTKPVRNIVPSIKP